MYGIKDKADVSSDEEEDDIEAAIQKEVAALSSKGPGEDSQRIFTPLKMNVDCILFFKTAAPVEPVEFVKRICTDGKTCADPTMLKCRYVNRLTPVSVIGKANETAFIDVAKQALAPYFELTDKDADTSSTKEPAAPEDVATEAAPSDAPAEEDSQAKHRKPYTVSSE